MGDRDKHESDGVVARSAASRREIRTGTLGDPGLDFDLDDLAADDPIDFSLVHADDEFLDALGDLVRNGHDQPHPTDFGDDELATLLTSWREEVDSEPIGELVDDRFAVATVHAARFRKRKGPRLLVPVAAAAAVLAIAFTGMGLAARDAHPGDTLWGLTKVLYSEHARSVEAADSVTQDLREAKNAIEHGNTEEAKSKLADASTKLTQVMAEDGKPNLQAQHEQLSALLPDKPSDGAPPPPAASPSVAPTDTSSTTTQPETTTVPTTTPPDTTTPPPPDTTTPPPTDPSPTDTGSGSGGTVATPNAPAEALAEPPADGPPPTS